MSARQVIVVGRVADADGALPFASVVATLPGDTTAVTGTATGTDGSFSMELEGDGQYDLTASFLGHKPLRMRVDDALLQSGDSVCFKLEADEAFIKAAVFSEAKVSYGLRKASYSFTKEEVREAASGQALLSRLPTFHIDPVANALARTDGKTVLVLIDGVKATPAQLRLLSAKDVAKADVYDIPPMRYMQNAEVVLDVHTRPPSDGMNGTVFLDAGQLFSRAGVEWACVRGNNQFALSLEGFVNPRRKVCDWETGNYGYTLSGVAYAYAYADSSQDHARQYSACLTWTRAQENDYTLQLSAKLSRDELFNHTDSRGNLAADGVILGRRGEKSDSLHTLVPGVDLYFSKHFGASHTVTANAVYDFFRNNQSVLSDVFDAAGERIAFGRLHSQTGKHGLVGELDWLYAPGAFTFDLGYRGQFAWMVSDVTNASVRSVERMRTASQYFFGEVTSQSGNFLYGGGVGVGLDTKGGTDGFQRWSFMPRLTLGWQWRRGGNLRLNLSTVTQMPEIRQMTGDALLISEHFSVSGNPALKSATTYDSRIDYRVPAAQGLLSVDLSCGLEVTPGKIHTTYVPGNGTWLLQPRNAHLYLEAGPALSLTLQPWKGLRMGADVEATYCSLRETALAPAFHHWQFPVDLFLDFSLHAFRLSCFQRLGGRMLNGIQLEGVEKVSYVRASYALGNCSFGVICHFPFVRDKFNGQTVWLSPVQNESKTHLATKDRTFCLTFTWNFSKGARLDAEKTMENNDADAGQFSYKKSR